MKPKRYVTAAAFRRALEELVTLLDFCSSTLQ